MAMRRTVAFSGMVLWVMASLVLLASCSKEPDAAVPRAEPVEATHGAEESNLTTETPDDSPEEEPDFSGVSEDPLLNPSGMSGDLLGNSGDIPTPFDVTEEPFPQTDEPADPSRRKPARTPDIHFVPTPQVVVDRMLELASVSKGDVVYDLGCGDGRIVVTAAKKFGCKALGVDIDPQRVEESLDNVRKNGVEDLVEIREDDIFKLDLSPASVVTLYLLPELNVRLIPQLEKLKPGTRIVSHDFGMEGVKPDKVEKLEDASGTSHTVYLWTTPLQKQD